MLIHNNRMTSAMSGEVVVFLLGMRVNHWWKPWQALRVGRAMARMLKELQRHPELGLLSTEAWFGRTTMLVSYWKTMDHLLAYAKLRDAQHLPAWRAFNRQVGTNGDIGIWHETYRARPGDYETVYVNMPDFGLGKVAGVREATGHRSDAAGRLNPA